MKSIFRAIKIGLSIPGTIFVVLLLISYSSNATAPLSPQLIYLGQQSPVWVTGDSQLDFPRNQETRKIATQNSMCSAIGSPQGAWRIEHGRLWLDGFLSCSGFTAAGDIYAVPGPISAEWVTADIAIYRGETLCRGVWGEVGVARTTITFRIEKGIVVSTEYQDNSDDPRVPNYALEAMYSHLQDPKSSEDDLTKGNSTGICLERQTSRSPDAMAAVLAPTGVLRVSIDLGNPIFAIREKNTGKILGISVDVAVELARNLRIPIELVPASSRENAVANVTKGEADIGLFPVEAKGQRALWLSPPLAGIMGYYTVHEHSPLTDIGQIDDVSMKIAVAQDSIYESYLSKSIKRATLVRISSGTDPLDSFLDQNLDAVAGLMYERDPAELKRLKLRVLDAPFMAQYFALGIPEKSGAAASAYLHDFIYSVKSGLSSSLSRHNMADVVTITVPGK
ncbi:hypothetical protein [Herbaspirillum robiniae]|uniref:hypothetical protein n=1 Tax=Herbaspirillum robiniae TaxID=2014887 RepID=UPI003D782377